VNFLERTGQYEDYAAVEGGSERGMKREKPGATEDVTTFMALR